PAGRRVQTAVRRTLRPRDVVVPVRPVARAGSLSAQVRDVADRVAAAVTPVAEPRSDSMPNGWRHAVVGRDETRSLIVPRVECLRGVSEPTAVNRRVESDVDGHQGLSSPGIRLLDIP